MSDATINHGNKHSSRKRAWWRGLFMLFMLIAFSIAQTVLMLASIAQFLWLLVTGEANPILRKFGSGLAVWCRDATEFLTCASEEKPFPWKEWPAPH